jgi:replicative DNA helicase
MNEIDNPPNNPDAEDAVLACCLIEDSPHNYNSVTEFVTADDFYFYRNQCIFRALGKLVEDSLPLDEIHLVEQLTRDNNLDEVGGISAIYSIMGKVETSMQMKYYADIVREKSNLRKMNRAYRTANESIIAQTDKAEDIKHRVDEAVNNIQFVKEKPNDLKDTAETIKEEFRQMMNGEFTTDALPTHIGDLDLQLGNGGIAPGEVVTLAAPTSCGKSALALNIALKSVTHNNAPCAVFSLEMPQKQLFKRMTQTLAGVNLKQIQAGVISEDNMKKVDDAIDQLHSVPLYTSHTVKSAEDLASQLRKLVDKQGVKLAVIDYLQLIPFNSGKVGKAEGIANISHKIKQLALELNIGILLLAQVNREGAKREGGRLDIYDLKDSGDIENDADVVLLMYPYQGNFEDSKMTDSSGAYTLLEYKIAKNREGERGITGTFKFYHITGRFY